MADLYLIFLVIAVLLFVLIVGYSYWQQRGDGERDAVRKTDKRDPLLDKKTSLAEAATDKSKKQNSSEAQAVEPAKLAAHPRVVEQDLAHSGVQLDDLSQELSAKPQTEGRSDSIVTELVARIKNPEALEQHELLTLFREHDYKFHRKIHLFGLNQLTDMWRDIEFELPSARFVELGLSIQLADREGAMSKKELHDFQQMALEYSNKFDAPFEFSIDIDSALQQAIILDEIGRRYDAMAVLNVVPRSKAGFRIADIESCARDLGLSADKNGIFLKTKGQRQNQIVLYRLACTDSSGQFGVSESMRAPVHDLVLYMNVPATPEPEMLFREMAEEANNLATWLDGKVVDRTGKVITQRTYTVLSKQISDIVYRMQQDGLVPGDQVSKKLF